jgi:recombination associated protein RdgC
MIFPNITLFNITKSISPEVLEEQLSERWSRKPSPLELSTIGWTSPISGFIDSAIYRHNDHILICMKKREKILPPQVVREALAERIEEIEVTEGREVRNKEKQRLRDEITVKLLPRAFTKSSLTHAVIDIKNNRLIVNTASRSRAEQLTVLLRVTLESLELTNPDPEISPSGAMTQWLFHGTPPAGFTIDDECVIQEREQPGGKATFSHLDITSAEVRKHLEQSSVVRLGMSWNDSLSFVLDENLVLRKIKPLDMFEEHRNESHDDVVDASELEQADFILMMEMFDKLIDELMELLGAASC